LPTPTMIAEAAARIVEALNRPGAAGGPSPLRLDDAIQARILLEESGHSITGYALETYSRILRPKRPPGPPRGRVYVGVDSGSRSIDTPGATLVLVSAAASSNLAPSLGDHPGLLARQLPMVSEPFMRVLPNSGDALEPVEEWVTVLNPAGDAYTPEYSVAQAMDEARVAVETAVLEALARAGERSGGLDGVVAMVDGPLFPATGALAYQVRPEYRSAWEALLKRRVAAVGKLEALGARVVGVVKRIQASRLLQHVAGLRERAAECAGNGYTDYQALYRGLYCEAARHGGRLPRGRVLVTPPFAYQAGPAWVPERAASYVALPASGYGGPPGAARVYRVETTLRSWEEGFDPVEALLEESVARGSLAPVSIALSDRRARDAAGMLQALVYSASVAMGVPVSYSSELEVIAGGARQ